MQGFAYRIAGILALVSAGQVQAAQTSETMCINRNEMRGLVSYVLPSLLGSTIDKCKGQLDSKSYLIERAPKLLDNLRANQSAAWPDAKKGIAKIGGGSKDTAMLDVLPEAVTRPLVEAMIADKFSDEIKPESCGDINRIMGTLEPLPAANMVDLLTETISIVARKDTRMPACPAA